MKADLENVSRRTFVAATALGLAGCASSSDDDSGSTSGSAEASSDSTSTTDSDTSVLRINIGGEPDYLDPGLISSSDCSMLSTQSFVGLYGYDENSDLYATLADGDPEVSEDGLTYTVKIKESQWSDGTELTANDFLYSWNRVVDDATAADYEYLFDVVARNDDGTVAVTADDDYTLTITLTNPCPYFTQLMAMITYFPVPEDEVEAADPDGTNPGAWCQEAGYKCNGAFKLDAWSHDESMTYVKNEYFYDADNVSLESLEYMLSEDDTATFAAYQSGDLDFADTIPTDELASVMEDEDFHKIPSQGTYYVAFNVNSDFFEGMTRDEAAQFRKAICLFIDRQYIVDTVCQCGQQVADSFICPGMSDGNGNEFKTDDVSYYDPSEEALADNQAEGREILEGLGYTFTDNGDGSYTCEPSITIPYILNEGSLHEGVAECIQQDLATMGITMSVELQDWNVLLENRKNGNYTFTREGWITDYDDPINYLELFTSDSGNNDPQFGVDPEEWAPEWDEYDEMIDEIRTMTDYEARAEKCHEAEDYLMATWAVIPIYYYNDVYLQKTNVDGIYAKFDAGKYFMYATKS